MATMTAAEADALWAGVDDQRARTTLLLDGLSAEQCSGSSPGTPGCGAA